MVYYFCQYMSLHVCPGEIFILDSCLGNLFGKETVLSAVCLKCFDCGFVA